MKIREFNPTEAEYRTIAAIEKAIWDDIADSEQEFKHQDKHRNPDYLFQRLVVETDGRIIAFAAYYESSWSYAPGKYGINIQVMPEYERQGVGTAVYKEILHRLQQRQPAPTLLTSHTYSHKPQSLRFLQKRGFKQVMRWINSELPLAQFDAARFAPLKQQITQQGIALRTLPEQQRHDPDWARAIYELDWELSQDEPQPQPITKLTFADYQNLVIKAPGVIPEAWLLAMDGERYIGMTQLMRNDNDPRMLRTGFTGVTRPYRRRGLATLLKVRAATYAQQHGYRRIRTGNEEHNPMYQLNRKLGFKDVSSFMAYEKRLTERN